MRDHLSKGRALLGIGRGLACAGYDVSGVAMNEAPDRFDEAGQLIIPQQFLDRVLPDIQTRKTT